MPNWRQSRKGPPSLRLRSRPKKLFVLGIDGVPFSLLERASATGRMPEFARLSRQGSLVQMRSVIPTISSVAWATFMTGVNPGVHSIYGFVDRDPEMRFTIPTSTDVKARTLWERLNEQGKRTVILNVPVTYPPKPLNGILVAGFLSPSLERACYPPAIYQKLSAMGYIIDPAPWKAKDDRDGFLEDCFVALWARKEVALELMRSEDWDFFMLHIMETDRVNHFYWDGYEDEGSPYHRGFWEFYLEVDQTIAEMASALPRGTEFLILSDHGFCGIQKEVDLNAYLCEEGFLDFVETGKTRVGPVDIHPTSSAYGLIPGRIFINSRGQGLDGRVERTDYEEMRREVAAILLELTDPEGGERIIDRVYRREELYHGPYINRAADLIAQPRRGYDLKAMMGKRPLFTHSHRLGMHTYEDALLFVKGHELAIEEDISILDVTPTIFQLMNLPIPDGLEGRRPLLASPGW